MAPMTRTHKNGQVLGIPGRTVLQLLIYLSGRLLERELQNLFGFRCFFGFHLKG
jgi:hypothetical protein